MLPCQAVNPVGAGKARARAQSRRVGDYTPDFLQDGEAGDGVLCFQIHGDGAFSAQVRCNHRNLGQISKTLHMKRIAAKDIQEQLLFLGIDKLIVVKKTQVLKLFEYVACSCDSAHNKTNTVGRPHLSVHHSI